MNCGMWCEEEAYNTVSFYRNGDEYYIPVCFKHWNMFETDQEKFEHEHMDEMRDYVDITYAREKPSSKEIYDMKCDEAYEDGR